MRHVILLLHRYVGLATALFLAVAGLTGAVIAFERELDSWLNPTFFEVPPGRQLSVAEIVRRVERAEPSAQVSYLRLATRPGETVEIFVLPRLGASDLGFSQGFVDPATGEIVGRRFYGACCFERENLIPFLYEFHYSLTLPAWLGIDEWGVWLMGVVALLWCVDCFFGAYLTLPRGGPFLRKWRPAWLISARNIYRTNLDLHRANGLWLWGLLLILAISSVALNLHDEVFEPTVELLLPTTPDIFHRLEDEGVSPLARSRFSFDDVLAKATAEAERLGWQEQPFTLFYSPLYSLFGVGFGTEYATGYGNSFLYFDGRTGRLLDIYVPGAGPLGNDVLELQFPLHSGRVAGLAGRIVIAVSGVVVALLSVTGIYIWWRKRRARLGSTTAWLA